MQLAWMWHIRLGPQGSACLSHSSPTMPCWQESGLHAPFASGRLSQTPCTHLQAKELGFLFVSYFKCGEKYLQSRGYQLHWKKWNLKNSCRLVEGNVVVFLNWNFLFCFIRYDTFWTQEFHMKICSRSSVVSYPITCTCANCFTESSSKDKRLATRIQTLAQKQKCFHRPS